MLGRNSSAIRKDNSRGQCCVWDPPWPCRRVVLAEAFPAHVCFQAPAKPGAKSQYTNWDAQQGLQKPHAPISQAAAQVFSPSRQLQQTQVMFYNQEHRRRYKYPPPFLSRCLLHSCPLSIPLGLQHRDSPATAPYKAAQGPPGQPGPREETFPIPLTHPKPRPFFYREKKNYPPMPKAGHQMDQG